MHEVGVSWGQNAKAQKRIQLSASGLWERGWGVKRGESGVRCSGELASKPRRASANGNVGHRLRAVHSGQEA